MMILRHLGDEAEIQRFIKCVADDVCLQEALESFRRFGPWLIICFVTQLMTEARDTYKVFASFFQSGLLSVMLRPDFSSKLIHLTRIKTARRIYKMPQGRQKT